jgi:HAD superfamily hydrolase (TIGR01549 family)
VHHDRDNRQERPNLKAVVFDLDGTLTVLAVPLDAMRRETKQYLYDNGLPKEMLDPSDGISSSIFKAKSYFLSHGVVLAQWQQIEEYIESMLSEYEAGAARDVRPIEGALDAVRVLKSKGLKTAILTNNGRQAVDIVLEIIPMASLFDVIQTRNESPTPKPFPDGLMAIVNKLGVKSTEALYVGDALIDAVAAKRAGIVFWGVTTGETSRETLLSAGAELVAGSLHEMVPSVDARLRGHPRSASKPPSGN